MALMPYFSTNDGLQEYESGHMRRGQDMKRPRTVSDVIRAGPLLILVRLVRGEVSGVAGVLAVNKAGVLTGVAIRVGAACPKRMRLAALCGELLLGADLEQPQCGLLVRLAHDKSPFFSLTVP